MSSDDALSPSFATAGQLTLSRHGAACSFSEMRYSFPLKLMAPKLRAATPNVGVCYLLTYGGGLVSRDVVDLQIRVEALCTLLLLTQVGAQQTSTLRLFQVSMA